MSRDTCPTCGIPWPNFCPRDGTKLEGPWTCPNAVAEVSEEPDTEDGDRPAVAPGAARDPDATVLETPAVPASSARDWIAKRAEKAKKAAGQDPDDVKTVVDMEAVTPPGRRDRPRTRPAKRDKRLSERALGRIAQRVKGEVSEERKPVARGGTSPSEEAAPERAATGKGKGKGKGRRRDEFSETQWFMKGLEVDADLLETVDEDEYKRDESISEDERQQYTLRDEDED
ncbi:MAG: hypothetical protein ACQEXJ_15115 [Myxococcota bacterium]